MTANDDTPSKGQDCNGSTFTVESIRADPNSHPHFDAEMTVDRDRKDGHLLVSIGLTKDDCESLWEIGDAEYADDVKEQVLTALFGEL